MILKNRIKLLVTVSLILLIAAAGASKPRRMQHANGTIEGPLTFDSKGRFTWRGTHNPEHGGPTRVDEKSNSHAVIYTGWVKGDKMSLTLKRANNEVIDTFTLTRGGQGRIFKCK